MSYARIAQRLTTSIWLITQEGGDLLLEIFERRMANDKLTDEEIAIRLEQAGGHGSGDTDRPYSVDSGVATLGIYGPIFGKANLMTQMSGATSMEQFRNDFQMAINDSNVRSVLLDVDSPGGSSQLIEQAGNDIFEARDVKPIYAIANGDAGSAAYWLASQAEKLFVAPGGNVGSIGAYTIHKDQSVRDANEGFKYTLVSAGKYKVEGNPHEPLTNEGREYRQEVIDELYGEFVDVVARGRNTTAEMVESHYGQGRMVPSKKALIKGMVDGIKEFDHVHSEMSQLGSNSYMMVRVNGQMARAAVIDGVPQLSNTDYEHSEPGTGSPPQRREREDTDRAIESGSRRSDIPDPWPEQGQFSTPGAPKAMADEPNVRAQLLELLGVESDEQLLSRVNEMKATADALTGDVSQAKSFAQQFPEEYARMERQDRRLRETEADMFVASISRFTQQVGESTKQTNFGLSGLAKDMIKESHIKLASGSFSLSDFENLFKAIQSGHVDFGDKGSTRAPEVENDDVVGDVSTPDRAANLRFTFAAKVKEIQEKDKLSFKDALTEASRIYPEMAAAYRNAIPVK